MSKVKIPDYFQISVSYDEKDGKIILDREYMVDELHFQIKKLRAKLKKNSCKCNTMKFMVEEMLSEGCLKTYVCEECGNKMIETYKLTNVEDYKE